MCILGIFGCLLTNWRAQRSLPEWIPEYPLKRVNYLQDMTLLPSVATYATSPKSQKKNGLIPSLTPTCFLFVFVLFPSPRAKRCPQHGDASFPGHHVTCHVTAAARQGRRVAVPCGPINSHGEMKMGIDLSPAKWRWQIQEVAGTGGSLLDFSSGCFL